MKTCRTCSLVKAPEDFAKDSTRADGLRSLCRECDKIRKRAYYATHKEQARRWGVRYRAENRERLNAQRLEYSRTHKAEKHAGYVRRLEENRARARAYDAANKEKRLAYRNRPDVKRRAYLRRLEKERGVTAAQLADMEKAQRGLCACCGKVRKLHVDHRHTTGKVRGLLCGSCNRGIGLLQDSPEVLEAAARYLRAHP